MKKILIAAIAAAVAIQMTGAMALDNPVDAVVSPQESGWQDRIAVTVSGAGPDLVLIPGLSSGPDVWEATRERLSARYRVHSIHIRGFSGLAPPSDTATMFEPSIEAIAGYLAEAGIMDAAIAGHSMGGAIGLALAARHGDRVGRVMVVDALPFYSLLFGPMITPASVAPQAVAMRAAVLQQSDQTFAAGQPRMAAMLSISPQAQTRIVAASISSSRAATAQAMYELMTTDLRPELAAITDPVTVLYAHDPAMGVSQSMVDGLYGSAYTTLPGVKLARIDGSFHFIMDDQPAAFAEAVDRFLSDQ